MKIKSLLILSGVAAIIAACTNKYPQPIATQPQPQIQPPIGATQPVGYVHQSGDTSYTVVSYQQLPNWHNNPFSGSLKAFRLGCDKLAKQAAWTAVCNKASLINENDAAAAKAFFEQYFTPWQVAQNGKTQGLFTGYYEAVLGGSLNQTPQARFPIYGVPNDFVSIPITPAQKAYGGVLRVSPTAANRGVVSESGSHTANLAAFPLSERSTALKGRFVGGEFVPYHTRPEINGGALNGKAPILAYANDPVELFFLHVQGSGRLRLNNGQYLRLAYADKNDYPYVSIGKYMAERGYLSLNQASAQGIQSYLANHPSKLAEILGQNPSYIFFKQGTGSENDGPVGALGVPLEAEFSGAVDKQYITLGAPIFVATTHPSKNTPLNRLIMAQDTGSAIKGAVRVDYFWGFGYEAGQTAGKMKHQGYVWQLLPNGLMPK